jgi:hypothetical protein
LRRKFMTNATTLRNLQILFVFALVLAGGASSFQASDWRVGDVFVGIGNGQYKVFDNDGNLEETIRDGEGGTTGGCAFDSTYHLVTTSISKAKVLRYKIDDPHGVLQVINPASSTSGAGSVVFAGNGDFYVGDPGEGSIRKYNRAGVLLATYPVAVENSGSDWIDLILDGKTIFYTSEGRQIKRFDVFNNAQLLDFVDLGNAGGSNFRLFALRLLPGGGLLVADKRNIKRLNSVGTVVKEYDADGQNDWRSLNLDPNQLSFWAGDATSGRFYRFNIATGTIEVGPVNTQSGNLSGICVDGAFSAAQATPLILQPFVVTDADANPTHTFRHDDLPDGSKLRVTLNDLAGSVKLTGRVSVIHKDAGFSDQEMRCTPTEPNGDQCIVWNIEATPVPPGSRFSSADLQIFQPNTDMNTRVLKNEATNITTFVRNIDPGGRIPTFSVFSLNQASVTGNAVSCGYQTPVENSVYNLGSNLAFRFQAAVDCKNGPFLGNLQARLSLVRLVEGRAPESVEVKVVGISNNPPVYRLQADGKTYHLNVKTTNLSPGVYLATTFDDSGRIPAFEVQFTLR